MGRRRADGSPSSAAVRSGKSRPTASGRAWRVRAYGPSSDFPRGRVTYRRPETGRPTQASPQTGQTLDALFDQIERALDQSVATGPGRDRTMRALGSLYLDRLEALGRTKNYRDGRRGLLSKWVYPLIGDVLVADWASEHSEKVLLNAAPHLGPARLEDLGSVLSGLRQAAHRRREGVRWLSLDENPLEDVSFTRRATEQGASRKYIPRHKRPSTERVHAAIAAAREVDGAGRCALARWDWMPLLLSIAAFSAPRLGEQLGLRAIDVHLDLRTLDINGAWQTDNTRAEGDTWRQGHRVPTKNTMRRTTPYIGSIHEELLAAVTEAMGLPAGTPQELVEAAVNAERERRAGLTRTGDWRDYNEPVPADEPWLFKADDRKGRKMTGCPPTNEMWNDAWHVLRDAIEWPPYIPYKNLRHHAACWWHDLDFAWETIALWDGHDVKTLMAYYVLPAENAHEQARAILDQH